ncbi:MAG: SIMPL domain-containing protein [Spirochaetia bacterium]|nr:SIMPL domain-containing protein [Spirochaetia bacterium]
MENKRFFIVSAAVLAIGIVLSGLSIAFGIKALKADQRTVSVRGLSEREIEADLAVWPVTFTLSGNDLSQLRQDIVKKTNIIISFLKTHGLKESDFTVKEPAITDTTTDPYMDQTRKRDKYFAKVVVFVRSSNINAVNAALSVSIDLMDSGIALSHDYDSRVEYLFTKLNDIKPQMIAEATQNAHKAAEQFAHDSGSKVGKIKRASQGLFSIDDAAPGLPERKSVRVVTTVEYILSD